MFFFFLQFGYFPVYGNNRNLLKFTTQLQWINFVFDINERNCYIFKISFKFDLCFTFLFFFLILKMWITIIQSIKIIIGTNPSSHSILWFFINLFSSTSNFSINIAHQLSDLWQISICLCIPLTNIPSVDLFFIVGYSVKFVEGGGERLVGSLKLQAPYPFCLADSPFFPAIANYVWWRHRLLRLNVLYEFVKSIFHRNCI